MLTRFVKRLVIVPAVAATLWGGTSFAGETSVPARVLRHSAANGQTFSAVVVKASELPRGTVSRDHIILIDTSASQVGEHRQQGQAVLEALLGSLPPGDRVRLFAADLQADAMDEGFASVGSQELADSVDQLQSRIPLGATNLESVLRTAMAAVSDRPADITYIGDGMSTADLIDVPELQSLVGDLRQRQIPVHSFGVGSQRNMQLLGILAQQTGGFVALDTQIIDAGQSKVEVRKTKSVKLAQDISRVGRTSQDRAKEQGKALAAALSAPVYFPTQLQVFPAGISLLPGTALPLRHDRETIYVTEGTLPADARVVMTNASGESLEWQLSAPLEQPGATFLPAMAAHLKTSAGLTNPLAGMTLFQLAQIDFSDNVTLLAQRGGQALQNGDVDQARLISAAASEADPNNETAAILRNATGRLPVRLVSQTTAEPPEPALDDEARVTPNPNASLLDDQRQMIVLQTQKLRNEVSNSVEAARHSLDPEGGLARLKQTLGAVKAAIDIPPEDRQRMQKQLESEIQMQENQSELKHQQQRKVLERQAQDEALRRLSEQASLDEERLENLIDRVRSLMLEGKHGRDDAYAEAQEVADVAINMRPGEASSASARFDAEAAQQLNRAYRLRARRADQFLEMLHQVELSHIPFPDEPPIRFPSAEVWKALSERRRQTATVDLKKSTPNEKRIQKALTESTEVAFNENPLEDALKYLEDLHHIEIWVDTQALQDEGTGSDIMITLEMTGITLRSALRLMLEPHGLTYLIEDEVMKITTKTKADEKMSTRVYPVADLVIPIMPPQSGMGGMGGMGGGMGGMGGGMGGMGRGGMGGVGGMGGGMGGMGGGMGGGMFSVPPENLPAK